MHLRRLRLLTSDFRPANGCKTLPTLACHGCHETGCFKQGPKVSKPKQKPLYRALTFQRIKLHPEMYYWHGLKA